MSYESPQKSTTEEWNYKLPTLKSSSGNENLRNSNSENTNNVEIANCSVSVELLEKSPEMTVFISEKDLSPTSNAKDRSNLNNRIQEINCLREKEENKEQTSNAVASEEPDQINPDNSINNKENLKPVISQEEIMQKLNFLKEPEINYNKLLNQKIESDNEDVKNQNLEIVNGQTDEIEKYVYQMILDEIYSDMYPQRVIVPYLRQKFDHDILEETSPPKEDISESDTSISHTDTGIQISDTTVDQESELCLK